MYSTRKASRFRYKRDETVFRRIALDTAIHRENKHANKSDRKSFER